MTDDDRLHPEPLGVIKHDTPAKVAEELDDLAQSLEYEASWLCAPTDDEPAADEEQVRAVQCLQAAALYRCAAMLTRAHVGG